MTGRPAAIVEYGAFQQPPSALFRDYLAGAPSAAGFYEGGRWDLDAIDRAADAAVRLERPRAALAAALVRQQEARGAPAAADRARALQDPRSTAVVTGQQAGLFGGALYVLYKALGAIRVAAELERRRGAPVVPVFWVASDDHDFAEVRSATVLDEGGGIRTFRYAPSVEPSGVPASRIVLDGTVVPLVEELRVALPERLHRDDAAELVAQCYRPGETLAGAFARLLSSLFPSLVVLDPSDPELKRLAAPVMERELREGSPTSRLAAAVGERLRASGYHQQVPVRPGFLNLFLFVDEQRRALATTNGSVEVRGTGRRLKLEEALRSLASDPGSWSPGVLLRPLAQDLLLPTAAYVGGPAEVAYHAEIAPSYGHFGIPRPVVLPRPSVTVVEPAQARAMEAESLTLPDLQADPEALLSKWARDAYPEVESGFAAARGALAREMDRLEETLATLDPTLRAAADAARGRALHQIGSLHEKATRALKKRDQTRADRLRRTRDALLPGGAFQERGLGLVHLVARHGRAVVDDLLESIDPFARGHQVIHL
ncbi:MAG TPA: bacillithiol biosynthesis cysteine-adding enzyme BshC [Vicinamibacteria bacterium]|nr:bacillithiol biosynthesis cysteine-adding enzyme BshC [Vicinamibacteria bacterium]